MVNEVAGKPRSRSNCRTEKPGLSPWFAHIAKNLSDHPFRNITIELLQDKKTRKSTTSEDRGLHILNGGTEDILFVKDGVRTSDFQLNPGGVVPKHRDTGPCLIVAVSDLNLGSELKGNGAIQLKAGDIAWIKGGLTRTLTNAAQQNARFITLEFR